MLKKLAAKVKTNQSFLKWLISRPSTIAGIDIGSCFIKVVEISFSKGKQPVLKTVGVADMPEGLVKDGQISDIPALAGVLSKLWKDSRLTCRDVVAAIGASSAFVREVVLPAMSPEEIKEAVKWSEKEYIPYEPDSYYYDFAVISPGGSGEKSPDSLDCKVLLAAAQFKAVDDIATLLKMSNLRAWAIDIEHLAAKLTFADCSDWIVLDVGGTNSKVIVFSGGIPITVRAIPIGAGKERQPQLNLQIKNLAQDLADEVKRTLGYYFIGKSQVEHIYLTGGGARLKNLAENMAAELGQAPVKVHNPLSCIEVSPLLDREYLSNAAPQLTVAIGLALSGGTYD